MISREPRSRSPSRYPRSKALIVSFTTIYGFDIKRFMVGSLLPFSFKFAFGLSFWLDRISGTVAPIAIVLPLIDRPRFRLCNVIYIRKIPSHGSFTRQQTMFIVVLDVFDNCHKWKPMIDAQDIINWRCSGSYDKIAKGHQTLIGIGLRSGCMKATLIRIVTPLKLSNQKSKVWRINCYG